MPTFKTLAPCLAALLAAGSAHAAVIDFAGYAAGTRIDGALTIGTATFSSTSGTLLIDDFGAGNAICAYDGLTCTDTLVLDFARGANNLAFGYSGDDVAGSAILYQGQTPRLAFIGRSVADGDPATRDPVRLTFRDIRQVGLFSNDPGGVAFGNVSFTTAVPEPAAWMTMALGFAAAGLAARRRAALAHR